VIKSFKCSETERLFNEERVGQWQQIESVALRKLTMIHAAASLEDLKVPPGNKLHKLSKDRDEQVAIWVNDKYRVCFEFREGNAYNVEIVDYHP
jgi:toxin HigB-1